MRRAVADRLPIALGLLAGALVLAHAGGADAGLLYLAPALLIAAVLVGGCYPGARRLERVLAGARRRPRRPRATAPRPRAPEQVHPRGGRLLAARLAGRGPPPAAPHRTQS